MFYTNDRRYQQILRDAIQFRILRRTIEARRNKGDEILIEPPSYDWLVVYQPAQRSARA